MKDRRPTLLIAAVALGTVLTGCYNRDSHAARRAPVLVFSGRGTSSGDVAALEKILRREHLGYSLINTEQLNRITELALLKRRLLIIPGGNFEQIGRNLTPDAVAHIRSGIGGGLNYLGICAGAFFAGNSPYNGLNLTFGVRFDFYAAEARGIRKTAVAITDATGHTLDQYWEDGPQLTGWGTVVAKYPDGTPALVQGMYGRGGVILSGVHPEAPEAWRHGMDFNTPTDVDSAYAAALVRAALNRESLPHY